VFSAARHLPRRWRSCVRDSGTVQAHRRRSRRRVQRRSRAPAPL